MSEPDPELRGKPTVPLLWINLRRADRRRRRMTWALERGGWEHERLEAVDAEDAGNRFRALPDPWVRGNRLPGIRRLSEAKPLRRTTRGELACLASWQRAVARAGEWMEETGASQILLMEDDVGASLAVPGSWPSSLQEIIRDADERSAGTGSPWTVIQLAPISPQARRELYRRWASSGGRERVVPKSSLRSHGNGAVLLHRRSLPRYDRHVRGVPAPSSAASRYRLRHPWAVRPVADKWIYSTVPAETVYVATFPLFCLDAADSDLHPDHVEAHHRPSREVTLDVWRSENLDGMIRSQAEWDRIE